MGFFVSVNLSVFRGNWGEQWDCDRDTLNFPESGWWGRILSEMKTLIPILIGLLVVGCGEKEEPKPRVKAGTPLPSTAPVSKQETAKNYSENVTKPKPKTTGSGGKHLIHKAANIGNVERVKQLLSAGVDIDLKNKAGGTPLHAASVSGRIEVVKLLISKLANVNAQNRQGVTPLSLAIDRKHPEVAKLLRENGAKTAKELTAMKDKASVELNNHAFTYYYGEGVKKDLQEAYKLFFKAAEKVVGSQHMVGMMLLAGEGVKKNPEEGVRWLLKAAKHDRSFESHIMLAECFLNGTGVPPDKIQGYAWYEVSVVTGMEDLPDNVKPKMKALAARMTAEEIGRAKSLAKDMLSKIK